MICTAIVKSRAELQQDNVRLVRNNKALKERAKLAERRLAVLNSLWQKNQLRVVNGRDDYIDINLAHDLVGNPNGIIALADALIAANAPEVGK